MNLRFLCRRAAMWSFLWLMLVRPAATAQRPIPDGSDRHPSDLRHPLNTWTQPEPIPSFSPFPEKPASRADMMRKLHSIIVPNVEFRRTTFNDAVEYLRQMGRRLDPNPNPNARGVNVFVKMPAPPPASAAAVPIPGLPSASPSPTGSDPTTATPIQTATITLTLVNIPLFDVFKAVAAQVGMAVKVEASAVSFVPLDSYGESLITAEYRVAPEAVGLPADANVRLPEESTSVGGRVTIRRVDVTPWFKAQGVEFPPGAVAAYLPTPRKLIVRNTEENLDKIDALLSPALNPAEPTPANP